MSGRLEARLRRLEKEARPEQLGALYIWFEGSGSPEPETKPGDTLIVFKVDEGDGEEL